MANWVLPQWLYQILRAAGMHTPRRRAIKSKKWWEFQHLQVSSTTYFLCFLHFQKGGSKSKMSRSHVALLFPNSFRIHVCYFCGPFAWWKALSEWIYSIPDSWIMNHVHQLVGMTTQEGGTEGDDAQYVPWSLQQAHAMDVVGSLKLHGFMVNMMDDVDSMCRSKSWKCQNVKLLIGRSSFKRSKDWSFATADGNVKLLRSAVLSTSLRNTKLCPCSSGVLGGFQWLVFW